MNEVCDRAAAPGSAQIIGCRVQSSRIICTAEGKALYSRGEEQEVQWQTDKMWLQALFWDDLKVKAFFLNHSGQPNNKCQADRQVENIVFSPDLKYFDAWILFLKVSSNSLQFVLNVLL